VASVRRATFQCRLDRAAWSPCRSPKRFSQLEQGRHVFRVRARKAGAVDPSPATRAFTVDSAGNETAAPSEPTASPPQPPPPEVPITKTQETAEEAAELYFPDAIDLDVPATCGGSPELDCPNGSPLPPEDQLSVSSTRNVVEQVGQSRYDVTAVSGVETLNVIKANIPLVGECDVTLTSDSAGGALPNWTIEVPLNFVKDPTSGAYRIEMGDLTLNEFEAADYSLAGNVGCSLANPGTSYFQEIYLTTLRAHFNEVGSPMCAAPGPAYLGPCPP